MKILIIGKGYLGSRMAEAWKDDAILTDVFITDKNSVFKLIDEHKPDAIVNAAGMTGTPNVDWCETHQAETFESNAVLPMILAEACQERGVYLLHLGSGCIFYGPSPDPAGWRESDFANPSAFYSRTKYAADLILSRLPNMGIARLRMPIDSRPAPRNLINKLAAYKQVVDVENSVTIVDDLIPVLHQMIEKRATGIFHVTNPGTLRHKDLVDLYREYVDPSHTCEWISDAELVAKGLVTKQRSNCILQSTRLAEYGIFMRPIEVALRDTMMKYAAAVKATMDTKMNHTETGLDSHLLGNDSHQPFNFLRAVKKEMKGVILAGGRGTRLAPLTNVTNKHLLPIHDRQMILYPLQTLLNSGIRDILIVTGPEFAGQFMNLLGSGASRGCSLTYRIQDESGGIAQALALAEDFVDGSNCAVILGDNIFDDNFAADLSAFQSGAMAFYKSVEDPQRFGVMELDIWGNVLSIEEKPAVPKSNFAQVGLYVYEPSVFEVIKTLKPSGRGELEITDVNNYYLAQQKLIAKPVRGFWSDAGTFASLKRATEYFAETRNTSSSSPS